MTAATDTGLPCVSCCGATFVAGSCWIDATLASPREGCHPDRPLVVRVRRCCHPPERHHDALRRRAVLATLPLPALASFCAEQIGTIERRLDSAGAVQIAGLKSGHELRTASARGLTDIRRGSPSDPEMVSTADHIAAARTLIVRASAEDRGGDKRSCENSMTEAKGMIGALP